MNIPHQRPFAPLRIAARRLAPAVISAAALLLAPVAGSAQSRPSAPTGVRIVPSPAPAAAKASALRAALSTADTLLVFEGLMHPGASGSAVAIDALGDLRTDCRVSDPQVTCSAVPAIFANVLGKDAEGRRAIEREVEDLLAVYRGLSGGPRLEFAQAATFLLAAVSSAFERQPTPQQQRSFRDALRHSLVEDGTAATSLEARQMASEVCGVVGVHVLRELAAEAARGGGASETAATRQYVDRLAYSILKVRPAHLDWARLQ